MIPIVYHILEYKKPNDVESQKKFPGKFYGQEWMACRKRRGEMRRILGRVGEHAPVDVEKRDEKL